jgi:hypothetical protein
MIPCLLADMDKNSPKQINWDKIKEITQNPDKTHTLFLNCLMEAMVKYTNFTPPPKRAVFSCISTLSVSQLQTSKKKSPKT